MCITCNVNNFNIHSNGYLVNELGYGKNVKMYLATQNQKDFKLMAESVETHEVTMFTTYRCPTCGRKFF